MRAFRIWLRERKRNKKVFYCPVCHLELRMSDLDSEGYTVCPVCSVVLEVVVSGGFPLPVVHDVELKRAQPRFRSHAMLTHLSIGLLPVALLSSIIALLLSICGSSSGCSIGSFAGHLDRLGITLFIISFIGAAATFGTGYLDWKSRYRGRPYHMLTEKIRLSIVLLVLGLGALFVRLSLVDIGNIFSAEYMVYIGLQAIMMAVIGIIGHIGGNLVFGK